MKSLGCAVVRQTNGVSGRNRYGTGQVNSAFNSWVDHYVVPRQSGQCFCHRVDVSVGEIQGDRFLDFFAGFAGRPLGLCLCNKEAIQAEAQDHQQSTERFERMHSACSGCA